MTTPILSLTQMTPDQLANERELALSVMSAADNSVLTGVIFDFVAREIASMIEVDEIETMQAAIYRVSAGLVLQAQERMAKEVTQ